MRRTLLLLILCLTILSLPFSGSAQIQKTADIGTVNSQTGTSYTFVFSDRGKLVTFSNGSAVSVTLPQATAAGNFRSGWTAFVYNLGAGTVTITPTTSTINGSASIALATGEGATLFSNGSNYLALRTSVAVGGGGGIGTVTTTGSPASGNLSKFSGATSITNTDLTGDVTTSGGVATTIANSAVTTAKIASKSGNATTVGTTSGSTSSGKCLEWDANGNIVTAASNAACGSGAGSGTVNSGVAGKLAAYPSTGSTVDDTADADSVSSPVYCADAGSNDTYTCSLSPAPSAYTTGTHYRFKANTANTGAATINFNSLGAKTIKKLHDQDLADNDIEVGSIIDLIYDGTNMQMQSQIANSAGGGGATANSTTGSVPYLSAASTFSDSPLFREDANTIAQRNGSSNQNLFIYKTFTDASNYARFRIGYESGTAEFFSEAAGTGTGSNILFKVGSGVSLNMGTSDLSPSSSSGLSLGANNQFSQLIAADIVTPSTGLFRWTGRGRLYSPADGLIRIADSSNNGGSGTLALDSRDYSIGADTNNFDGIVPGYFQRWTVTGASHNLTGLTFSNSTKTSGQMHLMVNVGSQNLVIKHQDTNSTAANRFLCSTGADITLSTDQAADIIYDSSTQRWRVFKRN